MIDERCAHGAYNFTVKVNIERFSRVRIIKFLQNFMLVTRESVNGTAFKSDPLKKEKRIKMEAIRCSFMKQCKVEYFLKKTFQN
jgi:hypothetical protein